MIRSVHAGYRSVSVGSVNGYIASYEATLILPDVNHLELFIKTWQKADSEYNVNETRVRIAIFSVAQSGKLPQRALLL